ncbi:MAG TPA: hypothetical protein VHX43_14525 [Xanthobacteraceae bacterium]|nr:hypothetical protein [Xanthobacteraceae bacterium]
MLAHDQDVMLGEGAIERSAGCSVDRLGEIDADDFGTGVVGQGRDGKGGHGRFLMSDSSWTPLGIILLKRYRR